jgi:hypothetical protein
MFSAAAVRPLASHGRSALLGRLLHASEPALPTQNAGATVHDALTAAFDVLRQIGQRDDHVYRTAVAQKLFLGRHSSNTAVAMFEARASRSRADVVILNGTSTAYEIKSERDSFARLHDQLQDYRQVWASVNIVTSPSRVEEALALAPSDVGVLKLTAEFTFKTVRSAIDDPTRINPLLLLDSLRVTEAIKVLEGLGDSIPALPNTKVRQYLTEYFLTVAPERLHSATLAVLKKSRAQHAQFSHAKRLPFYLRASAFTIPADETSCKFLRKALQTPLATAQQWS